MSPQAEQKLREVDDELDVLLLNLKACCSWPETVALFDRIVGALAEAIRICKQSKSVD